MESRKEKIGSGDRVYDICLGNLRVLLKKPGHGMHELLVAYGHCMQGIPGWGVAYPGGPN